MGQNHSHSKNNQNQMVQLAADGQQLVVKKKKFLRRKSHDDASQRENKKCNSNKVTTTTTCEQTKACMINQVKEADQGNDRSMRRVSSVRSLTSQDKIKVEELNIMENSSEEYRKRSTTFGSKRHQSPQQFNNYTVGGKQVTPVSEFLSASSTCDGEDFGEANSTNNQSNKNNNFIINQLTDAMLNANVCPGNEERRSAINFDPIEKQNFMSGNLNQQEFEFTGQAESVSADICQELAKVTFNWVDACANNVQLIVLHDEKVVSRVPMTQVQKDDDEVFRVTLVLQPGHEYQYYFMVDGEPRYSFEDNYTYMSVDVGSGSSSTSRNSSPSANNAFNSFNSSSDCEDNQQDLIVNLLLLQHHDVRYHQHHYQYYQNNNCNYNNNCCKHLIACGDEVPADNSAAAANDFMTTTNTETTTNTTMTIWPIEWFIIPMPISTMMMAAEDVFAMEFNQFTQLQQQQQCSMVVKPKRKPVVKKPKSKKKVHFGVACFFDY